MRELFVFFVGVLSVVLVWHFSTKKFIDPYELTMVFGKKGCGKSTLLTKLAFQHLAAGWTVYCTEPIPGCYVVAPEQIGIVEFEENSVLLVDEAGMIWDNRGFKNFSIDTRDWFKLQRHRKVKVYLFSQTFDVDKKIRDLTDHMYLIQKKLRVFSYGKRILTMEVLHRSSADSPAHIDVDLTFDPFIFFLFGSRILTYIPRYAKYFDSFSCKKLKVVEFPYIEPCDNPFNRRKRIKFKR